VGRLLASLHPETEELAPLAAHMIVRLLNAGHDDVAYNLVQFLAENSAEESSRLVSAEFLEQLVRTNATVTKLLWFLKVCRYPKLLYWPLLLSFWNSWCKPMPPSPSSCGF
jgi:hypothetical protein